MQRHFDQELADLKSQILRMGGLVESQIEGSIKALVDRDVDLASASSNETRLSIRWMWTSMKTACDCLRFRLRLREISDLSRRL